MFTQIYKCEKNYRLEVSDASSSSVTRFLSFDSCSSRTFPRPGNAFIPVSAASWLAASHLSSHPVLIAYIFGCLAKVWKQAPLP
jgi:hypothetical protein